MKIDPDIIQKIARKLKVEGSESTLEREVNALLRLALDLRPPTLMEIASTIPEERLDDEFKKRFGKHPCEHWNEWVDDSHFEIRPKDWSLWMVKMQLLAWVFRMPSPPTSDMFLKGIY